MAVREYWRDGDGLVHLLDYKFHITLCEGLYRMGSVRLTFVVPTCFQCLAREIELGADPYDTYDNGEPGVMLPPEWLKT